MAQYIDCYFLIDGRNSDLVKIFLKKYLPVNKESAEDYPIPLFSDHPVKIFDSVNDLLMYLENNKDCKYSIYWHTDKKKSDIEHVMVFYTDDGKMIFGTSISGNNPMEINNLKIFRDIRSFLNSEIGCMTVEEPPPFNSSEFVEFAKNRYSPD